MQICLYTFCTLFFCFYSRCSQSSQWSLQSWSDKQVVNVHDLFGINGQSLFVVILILRSIDLFGSFSLIISWEKILVLRRIFGFQMSLSRLALGCGGICCLFVHVTVLTKSFLLNANFQAISYWAYWVDEHTHNFANYILW